MFRVEVEYNPQRCPDAMWREVPIPGTYPRLEASLLLLLLLLTLRGVAAPPAACWDEVSCRRYAGRSRSDQKVRFCTFRKMTPEESLEYSGV